MTAVGRVGENAWELEKNDPIEPFIFIYLLSIVIIYLFFLLQTISFPAANVKVMPVLRTEYGTFLSNSLSSMSCFFWDVWAMNFHQWIFAASSGHPHFWNVNYFLLSFDSFNLFLKFPSESEHFVQSASMLPGFYFFCIFCQVQTHLKLPSSA